MNYNTHTWEYHSTLQGVVEKCNNCGRVKNNTTESCDATDEVMDEVDACVECIDELEDEIFKFKEKLELELYTSDRSNLEMINFKVDELNKKFKKLVELYNVKT
jgi:hypothetical protein